MSLDHLDALIKRENWHLITENGEEKVIAYGQTFPKVHPLAIYEKLYRTEKNPQMKYVYMKWIHDALWPNEIITWNYWTERRFKTYCEGWRIISWAGGASIGKELHEDTLIRTPIGWVKIKDIKVDDTICDVYGGTQQVKGVYPQGIKKLYKVSFSDGTSILAGENHLWHVQSKKQRDHNKDKFSVFTTLEIKTDITKNFSIPIPLPLVGVETIFTLHPYALGVCIGDGSKERHLNLTTCTIGNIETVENLKAVYPVKNIKYIATKNCWTVYLGAIQTDFGKRAENKFIPKEYLIAATPQRLALLQGLMDTDGYCSKLGGVQYTTVSPKLADNILDLGRGLGFICTISSKLPTYTSKGKKLIGQRAYTITFITTTTAPCPFSIQKKKDRFHKGKTRYHKKRIVSIEYSHDAPAYCITVTGKNSLYIAQDYIVTHNSVDASKIAVIEWVSNPKNTAIIVASTTLESLNSRVFGYLTGYLKNTAIKIPYKLLRSQPPKIMYDRDDSIHTISAIAAAKGKDEEAIKNYIGRHPKQKLFIILDEAPDLDLSILSAIPNLEAGQNSFQVIAIGNSCSKNDLHGSLSVPENGWSSVDPLKDNQWKTTQKNGLCLFFSCYESPAIFEKDAAKKAALSKFLPTEEQIIAKKKEYGETSDAFWRFVLGFWRLDNSTDTIVSATFLKGLNINKNAEWSGLHSINIVAGLDPAFSVGGDKCVLRLAMLGQDISGKIVLDYRGDKLLFKLHISSVIQKSVEEQIAEQVIKILNDFNCPLHQLCVDANGAGRALSEVIKLKAQALRAPLKIYSVKGGKAKTPSFDIIIRTPYELWYAVREFINHGQIRGLDQVALTQLISRLIDVNKITGKQTLEQKIKYKQRMGAIMPSLAHSPDEMDAAALCLQSAILNFGFSPGQVRNIGNVNSSFFDKKMWIHQQNGKAVEVGGGGKLAPPVAGFKEGVGSLVGITKKSLGW